MEPHVPRFQTQNESLQRLYDAAEQKARRNLCSFGGRRVLVEGGGYEKIWLETQPMGGAMYALRDPEAGRNNQLLFMELQRKDGRLPGSIALVDGQVVPQFNKIQGFCFPDPALDVYYLTGRDPAYLDLLYTSLERFDRYLWAVRDSDGDGCLESWCKYDTGEDNAVRYGDAPDDWPEEVPPSGCSAVPMASMDFMSFSYSARKVMADIATLRGDEALRKKHLAEAGEVAKRLKDYLWREDLGALFDRGPDHAFLPELTHNTLRAMYFGSISAPMAERFVREHLLDPAQFWTPMPLPSVAACDPSFRNIPSNNWSGQCEALTYQRAIRALENYGFYPLIPQLGRKLIHALSGECRFVQQFDPFTGAPSRAQTSGGSDGYGPTILSVLEYTARMWGISVRREELIWGLTEGPDNPSSVYEQEWNGHLYRLQLEGERAEAFLDGRLLFSEKRGLRIVTDLSGNIMRKDPYQEEK